MNHVNRISVAAENMDSRWGKLPEPWDFIVPFSRQKLIKNKLARDLYIHKLEQSNISGKQYL